MEATTDPDVLIEARGEGWIRYVRADGRRWEVHGRCDHRGFCMIGAVVAGVQIRDLDHLAELVRLNPEAFDPTVDNPVTPELRGCCPFTFREL